MHLPALAPAPAEAVLPAHALASLAPPALAMEHAPATVAETPPDLAIMPRSGGSLWNIVLPVGFFLLIGMLVMYTAPYLIWHWRTVEAQSEAEATYLKRRAELKAEAENADERLQALDKRVHLTGLGFREIVRKVSPKVVNVSNFREPRKGDLAALGKRMLFYDADKDMKYVQIGVGSGIVIKPGYVLTNHHVVKQAQRLRVTLASGQSIGVDPEDVVADEITDLAVIRLPANLPPAVREEANVTCEFADSDKDVHVGDWALAVGSPLGLRQTVTQGVISAKGRLLGMLDLVELLQTDAAINPGNSGGPLFDQYGRVVGINVAIASDNGANQGIGFAIPSNVAKKIFQRLVDQGEVPRGYLGIALDELPSTQSKKLGLGDQGAALVVQVQPQMAAEKAGMQVGDVILSFNNEALSRFQPIRHLRQMIVDADPDTQVGIGILRGRQPQTLQVTIGKRPMNLP